MFAGNRWSCFDSLSSCGSLSDCWAEWVTLLAEAQFVLALASTNSGNTQLKHMKSLSFFNITIHPPPLNYLNTIEATHHQNRLALTVLIIIRYQSPQCTVQNLSCITPLRIIQPTILRLDKLELLYIVVTPLTCQPQYSCAQHPWLPHIIEAVIQSAPWPSSWTPPKP